MLNIVSCLAALLKELDCSQEVPQLCQCVLSYNFVHFTSFLSKVFGCDVLSAQAYCFAWFCERVAHHFVAQIEQQCGSWTWQCFPSTRRCPVWCARVWHTVCPCVPCARVWHTVCRVVTVQGPSPSLLTCSSCSSWTLCALLITIAILQSKTNSALFYFLSIVFLLIALVMIFSALMLPA